MDKSRSERVRACADISERRMNARSICDMLRLRDETGISFLYITHDPSTVYLVGNDIDVVYESAIAERGVTPHVIESIPEIDPDDTVCTRTA